MDTRKMYEMFERQPLKYKVRILNWLGDHIREMQGPYPKTAAALQSLYDLFYMQIGQEQADEAFADQIKEKSLL